MTSQTGNEPTVTVRAPPDDAAYAGQILDGARMIANYLSRLGFEMTEKRVFHWAADGRLPVKKIGSRLVTNKQTLIRHFGLDEKLNRVR